MTFRLKSKSPIFRPSTSPYHCADQRVFCVRKRHETSYLDLTETSYEPEGRALPLTSFSARDSNPQASFKEFLRCHSINRKRIIEIVLLPIRIRYCDPNRPRL